jgi:hypothetical protein
MRSVVDRNVVMRRIPVLVFLVTELACNALESVWAVTSVLECNVLGIKRAFAKQVT